MPKLFFQNTKFSYKVFSLFCRYPYYLQEETNKGNEKMSYFNILNKVKHNGGITIDKKGKEYKGLGYGVAVSKDTEIVIDQDLFIPELIQAVSKKFENYLVKPNTYLGIWLHENKVFFDVTEIITDFEEAKKKGNERKQLAVFDFKSLQVIDLTE